MTHKRFEFLLAFFLFLFSLQLKAEVPSQPRDVVLAPNESQKLNHCTKGTIEVSAGNFFKVVPTDQGIKVIGVKKGKGHIRCLQQTLHVHVVEPQLSKQWQKLSEALPSSTPLYLVFENSLLVIKGKMEDIKDYKKILELNSDQTPFLWNAEIPPHLRLSVEKTLHEKLHTLGLDDKKVIIGQQQFTAQIPESTESKKITTLLQTLGVDVISQPSKHQQNPMVSVVLYFVEARSQFIRNLGLQWPSQQTFQVLPTTTMNTPLDVILKLGENHGFARTLASPQLLVRSGEKGEFVSGGEFPIRVAGFQSQSLFWKKYGLQLFVNPKVDSAGGLVMDLKFEVSMIDPARTVDGLPGLLTHQMQTQIQLEQPQPILISRLLKEDWGTSRQGLSSLKDIPLFGALFQSEDFLQSKSDLFIFVEPRWSK